MTEQKPRRGAGRPRSFDRGKALEAAMNAFWRHGYDGTPLSELTEAMGIAPPSLYAAFGSKEKLYLEALEHYQRVQGAYFTDALATRGPIEAVMSNLLKAAAIQFTGSDHIPGCMVATGTIQCSAGNLSVADEARKARMAAQSLIEQRLAKARADRELAADVDLSAVSRFLALVIQGMAVQARDGAGREALLRMAEIAMHSFPKPLRA